MIETPDGQTVQLNDSSQIISVLKTFIDHKAELSIDQLLKYYPHFEDEQKGWLGTKSTFDFPNKYFVMYFDEPADGMKYKRTVSVCLSLPSWSCCSRLQQLLKTS